MNLMNLSEHSSHKNPSGADLFLLYHVLAATDAGKHLSLTRLAMFLGFSPPESVVVSESLNIFMSRIPDFEP